MGGGSKNNVGVTLSVLSELWLAPWLALVIIMGAQFPHGCHQFAHMHVKWQDRSDDLLCGSKVQYSIIGMIGRNDGNT